MKKETKKTRDCTACIAYCNMLRGKENRCGLGFRVIEEAETDNGTLTIAIHPYENECERIELPETKEDFVKTAKALGISWDIKDVVSIEDTAWW